MSQNVQKLPHHEQEELCQTRSAYRQGKKLTAIKVYTINDESKHLIVSGVPKLQLKVEVKKLFAPYGDIKRIYLLPDYPTETFTEAFHVHYTRIQSARIAKRFIDGKNFYGGLLHVFYTPELESISETREKLAQRFKDVTVRIKRHKEDPTNPEIDTFLPIEQYQRKKKTPALPLTEDRLAQIYPGETLRTIYNGIPQKIDPRPISEPSLPIGYTIPEPSSSTVDLMQPPYQPSEAILKTADAKEIYNTRKRKNYKGQLIGNCVKNKIFRPDIVDTRNLLNLEKSPNEKKAFANVKKVESGITIKIIPKSDETKTKIVIKDSRVTQLVKPTADLKTSIQVAKEQIREAMQKKKL